MNTINLTWGNPEKNYNFILDAYSRTKINSNKTSSIPLAQYWKKYKENISLLKKELNLEGSDFNLFFEYSTPSYRNNNSSMSDIMIITEKEKIAVEAKFLEIKQEYQSIKNWFKEAKNEDSKINRKNVLNHWNEILALFVNNKALIGSSIPYQLLHRTASACYENDNKAIVLYEVFYDSETKSHVDRFIQIIKDSVNELSPKENLAFYLQTIKIENLIQYTTDQEVLDSIFYRIKEKNLYTFGKFKFIRI